MKLKLLFIICVLFLYSCSSQNNLELKSTASTQELNQAVAGIGSGNIAPDFVVVSTEGKPIRLSDYRGQKPVIVYFMATWCQYCREDYLHLSNVYKDYQDKVVFISISLDLSESIKELMDYKKNYPELQKTFFAPGQGQILRDYSITKTTTKYAVGKNGTIIYRGLGVFSEEQWKMFLDSVSG